MSKYAKLASGKIVPLKEKNVITTVVAIDLCDIIDLDLEGLLDKLSELATDSVCLTGFTYRVVGHTGDTLQIEVTGELDETVIDFEEIAEEDLPEQEFLVEVTRIGYGRRTVTVKAKTKEEAESIADDDAGNHLYSEYQADYKFEAFKVAA